MAPTDPVGPGKFGTGIETNPVNMWDDWQEEWQVRTSSNGPRGSHHGDRATQRTVTDIKEVVWRHWMRIGDSS